MPHVTVEYSDNLEFDVQKLLARLHEELVATGAIRMQGIKSRAVCRPDYRVADGNPAYAFVHVNLLIKAGRPHEVQAEMSRRVLAVLEDTFGERFEDGYLALSVDIQEMREGIFLSHHNIPGEGGG